MSEDGAPRRPGDLDPPGWRERIRYRFDNLLARGTSATLIWLGAVTLAAVLVSSLLLALAGVTFAGSEDDSWFEDVWQSLLRVMDPGTMAGDVGWGRRLLALLVTVFGLLVAGTLIGIIAAGVEDRIDRMRRGRSVVIESDHVVVLGWSRRLPLLLQQLRLAADVGGSRTIVVLADRDPAELHAALREAGIGGRGDRARFVFRSGDPTAPADLTLVRLPTARAVVVLSDQQSDVAALETVLGVASVLGGLEGLVVVVELLEASSARRLNEAYGDAVHPIVTSEAVARTTAFAARRPGLGRVLEQLLDFRGSDLHVVSRPDLTGSSFGELLGRLASARPIGLWRRGGSLALCPPVDAVVAPDDRIVMITHDPETTQLGAAEPIVWSEQALAPETELRTEHLLVLGWNAGAPDLIAAWATSVASSSDVDVVVDPDLVAPSTVALPDLGAIAVRLRADDDPTGGLSALDPSIVVLFAPPGGEDDAADVLTMLRLQAIHRTLATRGRPAPRLVVELRDAAHAPLLGLIGADDLVISDAMASQFIAQLVDQPDRRDVLLALAAGHGATLDLVAVERLDLVGDVAVGRVVAQAAAFGLLAIGWRRCVTRGGGVVVGLDLTSQMRLDPGDELVVVRPNGSGLPAD